ncbi:MAG: hypothetical protein AAGA02_09755 [Bacteroidota bacterium]
MKKVIEEFTGTIGVGCLLSLGLFLLTDSMFRYWDIIEGLMKTNSWVVLISVPILIINYIFGLITIEFGDLIFPKFYAKEIQQKFDDNFIRIVSINNDPLTSKYNELYQNKKILNGSSIGLVLIGIGVVLEGLPLNFGFRIIGFIGFIGSIVLAIINLNISKILQSRFNLQMEKIEQKMRIEEGKQTDSNA